MKIIDIVRAAKASIKSRSSAPIFMARLNRLQSEGRCKPRELINNWTSWLAYLQKLKNHHQLRLKSYDTLSRPDNPVACGLRLLINAPGNDTDDWTIIPILNKEKTDIKEIVIASPANSNTRGLLMDVARWRQNGGDWKFEGNIDRETWIRLNWPKTSGE